MTATAAAGVISASWCGFWAFAPLGRAPASSLNLATTDAAAPWPASIPIVDPKIFAVVNLWNMPPAPAPAIATTPTTSPQPPRPLRAQLLAIVDATDQRRAAMYDLDADRLVTLSIGDRLGEFAVTRIGAGDVELSDGRTVHQLQLRKENS